MDSGGITVNAEEQKKRSIILGNYGTDYYYRTLVAYYGLGALPPQEAIYIDLKSDAAKQQLNGNYNYIIHFDKGRLPPAKAFWSLTVYDKERYLSKNDINRYAIGDRDSLKYNADGSLDIHIGHQKPGAAKVSNWLPAPADQFYLIFRIYVPKENYVKNRSVWKNPQLQKITE
ncbi:MAG: DUF1214 domain-containing protein [Arachidicoccus sp.]|nr:DUF1214 domain-containing protein [Arachidicoccus sp.]